MIDELSPRGLARERPGPVHEADVYMSLRGPGRRGHLNGVARQDFGVGRDPVEVDLDAGEEVLAHDHHRLVARCEALGWAQGLDDRGPSRCQARVAI